MTRPMGSLFLDVLAGNRSGTAKGIYSICSANRDVLEACFRQAKSDGSLVLIESTSNQVDQFGGYTGMKPGDFVHFIQTLAAENGFPGDLILLGGDHLGPNAWQLLPATEAMARANELIQEYVKAGYQKIHLDTSMYCADDAGDRTRPLNDRIVATRTLELCKTAERTRKAQFGTEPGLIYIVGTEVPVPGGARAAEATIHPTRPEDAATTLTVLKEHFTRNGMTAAWNRVSGLVVQPGVEFSDDTVFRYNRRAAAGLSRQILTHERLVYEAHSTDYQSESDLKALVEDHFCILKVGPWLTFVYREALFALEAMEIELLGKQGDLSGLADSLDRAMVKNPVYWKSHYHGNEDIVCFKRKYSFSDRSRYYWTDPGVDHAKKRLFRNLTDHAIPFSLLSQFMPDQFNEVCENKINPVPTDLVQNHIMAVIRKYARACGLTAEKSNEGNSYLYKGN